jgi:hypothetical protein
MEMNQETKHQATTAWHRRQMMAGNLSLVENCRAGASPAWATGAVALQFYDVGRRGAALVAIMAESKAHKRPNLPCAWYFALYRASRSLISL